MCGIFGMIGDGAVGNTLRALGYLEYRGYDSAGIAALRKDRIDVYKTAGRIAALKKFIGDVPETDIAIGHTRWATHGEVCAANAHPFLSPQGRFAIVHNGIIENYRDLRRELNGALFTSDTDSEIVAHLLEKEYRGNALEAVLATARKLRGSFAIAIVSVSDRVLYAIKNKSPLIVGMSEEGAYLCSDIRCASHWASSVAVTPDDTVVELSDNGARFFRLDGTPIEVAFFAPDKAEEAERVDGDFMLKEITEIPSKLRLAEQGYFSSGGLGLTRDIARRLSRVYLIGCGTAYHSGLEAAAVARQWLDVDVLPVIASEFIYDNYTVDGDTLAIFISQSGETADTVRACERVRRSGGIAYAVTNTDSSSLTFACQRTLNIRAGAEYAVASTKAYNCQLVTLTLMLLDLGRMRGTVSDATYDEVLRGLEKLPRAVEKILEDGYGIAQLAEQLKNSTAIFYIGRTADYPTACEGSLKLKEISYIHSEAYPAGELKHGTLALIDNTVAVVAIATSGELRDKMASSVTEVATRGAKVIAVSPYTFENAVRLAIPETHPYLYGIAAAVPLQLLAYYIAKRLGRDVDKPRNLAKSVTVE